MEQNAWDTVKFTLEDSLSHLAEQLEGKVSKRLWNNIFSTMALCTSNGFKAGVTVNDKDATNTDYVKVVSAVGPIQERATELSFRVLNYKNNE
jgi:hypothetical protein